MIFGFPLAFILMAIIWKWLGVVFKSEIKGVVGGMETVNAKKASLGPMSRDEKFTIGILAFTIGIWVTTQWNGLDSFSVALIGAVLLFVFRVIDWQDAQEGVDWGLIIFFGGALSLGAALLNSGAAIWLVNYIVGFLGPHASTLLIMVVLMVIAQHQPIGIYAVPVAIACSLSYMLPMADPTVAMAYGTKYVSIPEIFKAGFPLVVIGIIVTIIVIQTIALPFIS
jgi:sodium-dependent dicarboxylate transporter 2/3/5